MSRLARNIAYNILGQSLLMLLGFVGVRYIYRGLGGEVFGIIQFTATMRAILYTVLGMGVSSTTTREVSVHFKDEPAYIRDLIRTTSFLCWSISLVAAAVIYFGAPFLVTRWINLEAIDAATATRMVRILGISSLSVFLTSMCGSLLRGLQRMEFENVIDVIITGLQQVGVIVILVAGGGTFDVVYWFAAAPVLGLLAYVVVCTRFFSLAAFVPVYSSAVVRRNFSYSSNMAATSMLALANNTGDKVVLSKLLPIGEFGLYNFAFSVVTKIKLGTQAISQAAFPVFSYFFSSGDRESLMTQYRKLQDLLCFASLPIAAATVFVTLPLFTYLFNGSVAHTMLLPVALLALGIYMNGTLQIPYIFSLAAGRPDIARRQYFYALFILPVQVFLIYRFGLIGGGLSLVAYHLFAYAYQVPKTCSECMEIPVSGWYLHVLKALTLAAATYGSAWLIVAAANAYSTFSLSLAYCGASVIYLVAAYVMIGVELRAAVQGLLRNVGTWNRKYILSKV
jgi:O-antigen/teichoic acid export membrane protein